VTPRASSQRVSESHRRSRAVLRPLLRVRLLRVPLLRVAALIAFLPLAAQCVAYRSGALAPGGGLEPDGQEATRSVAVLVRVKRSVNGEDRELPANLREDWVRATLDAYRDSGYFTKVVRGTRSDVDLQVSISIEDSVVGSPAFAYLSAMTWLLLPSRSQDQLSVRTTFSVPGGEVVGEYRSKETVTTWFQAFLLPATPFARRESVVSKTVGDLSRATAKTARKKGIL